MVVYTVAAAMEEVAGVGVEREMGALVVAAAEVAVRVVAATEAAETVRVWRAEMVVLDAGARQAVILVWSLA